MPLTSAVKPCSNTIGGSANQNDTASSGFAGKATGFPHTSSTTDDTASVIFRDGSPPGFIDTSASPESGSPKLPFRVMEDTSTPSP